MSFERVLPAGARTNEAGHLEVGGCDAVELAERFGTPLFVCDLAEVKSRLGRYRDAFGGDNVYYASKAFLTASFARLVAEAGVGMECVAGGEFFVATAGGFPPERISLHGNNKSATELEEAVEGGVGRIVVDALGELELIDEITTRLGRRVRILLRIAPGVDVDTHSYLKTGGADSKFGFSTEDAAMAAVARATAIEGVELVGLHSHIGSQLFDLAPFEEAARRMMGLLAEARTLTGLELPELDLGGGLGIAYLPTDEPLPVEDLAKVLSETVRSEAERLGTAVPTIKVEPGRSAVGPAMVTLYTVGVVKDVPGGRRYVAVDGGMSDNMRVPLYQAAYTYLSASRPEAVHDVRSTVAGKLCETGDLIGHDVLLPDVEPGEVVAAAATGAYGYAMASHYNKQPRPAVVGVEDGKTTTLARRETYEDLIRLDQD